MRLGCRWNKTPCTTRWWSFGSVTMTTRTQHSLLRRRRRHHQPRRRQRSLTSDACWLRWVRLAASDAGLSHTAYTEGDGCWARGEGAPRAPSHTSQSLPANDARKGVESAPPRPAPLQLHELFNGVLHTFLFLLSPPFRACVDRCEVCVCVRAVCMCVTQGDQRTYKALLSLSLVYIVYHRHVE